MKQPDMAFLGSEFPEPGMQPAADRAEPVFTATAARQSLEDSIKRHIAAQDAAYRKENAEDEGEPMPKEWRVWVLLVALNGLLGVALYRGAKWIGWL